MGSTAADAEGEHVIQIAQILAANRRYATAQERIADPKPSRHLAVVPAVSISVLDVDTVVVLQHTKCGLAGVSDDELRRSTCADLDFRAFNDDAAALDADLRLLTGTSYLSSVKAFSGLVYDVDTRAIESVVRWERPSTG